MSELNKKITVRFPTDDAQLILDISKKRGQNTSDFVRFAVKREMARLSYLSDDEKKALEIEMGA